MTLEELSDLFGLEPEDLVEKAKEFGVNILNDKNEVDPDIIQLLKKELGLVEDFSDEEDEVDSDEFEILSDEQLAAKNKDLDFGGLSGEHKDSENVILGSSTPDFSSFEEGDDEEDEEEEEVFDLGFEEDEDEDFMPSPKSEEKDIESEDEFIEDNAEEQTQSEEGRKQSEEAALEAALNLGLDEPVEKVSEETILEEVEGQLVESEEYSLAESGGETAEKNLEETDEQEEEKTDNDLDDALEAALNMGLETSSNEETETEAEAETLSPDEEDLGVLAETELAQEDSASKENSVQSEVDDELDAALNLGLEPLADSADEMLESAVRNDEETVLDEGVSVDEKQALSGADLDSPIKETTDSSSDTEENLKTEEQFDAGADQKNEEASAKESKADEEDVEKKKPGFKDKLAPVLAVVSGLKDSFGLIFQNRTYVLLLVFAAIISSLIALVMVALFASKSAPEKGPEVPGTVVSEGGDVVPALTPVQIQGGFRSEEDLFQLIWELYEQGYYSMAYEYAQIFLEEYSESEQVQDVYFKMGDISYDWNRESKSLQYGDARLAYEQAIELFPDNAKVPWAMYQVGNTYYNLKLLQDAAKAYRKVIELYPTFKDLDRVRYKLGLTYLHLQEFERSRMEFKWLIDTFPKSVFVNNAYLRIAETYYRSEDYANAIKNYLNYIERYPDSPKLNQIYFRIGKLSQVKKNYDAAIIYYKKSIGKYPFDKYNSLAKFYLANCWLELGNFDKARENYKLIIDEYPDSNVSERALFKIADAYLAEKSYVKAVESYEVALKKYPTSKVAKIGSVKLGEIYFQSNQYQKVADLYSELVVSDPNYFGNDRLVLRIAQAYFNQGDYLEASDWFLELIKSYPASDLTRMAYFGKAKAEESAEYLDKAIQSYEEFILNFPDHPQVDRIMFEIGNMFYEQGKYEEAIDSYEGVRSKFVVSDYRYKALVKVGDSYQKIRSSDTLLESWAASLGLQGGADEWRAELTERAREVFLSVIENVALEGTDEYFHATLQLSKDYINLKEFDLALDLLNHGLTIYGGEERSYNLLKLKGFVTYETNMLDETIHTYEDLISLLTEALSKPDIEADTKADYLSVISESYFALGDMMYAQDNFAESLYVYLEGIERMPNEDRRPWPFYQIANCYNRLNNYDKANFYYEKVKEEFPDNFWNEYIGWNQERMDWEQKLRA